jgi:hypothetical protein
LVAVLFWKKKHDTIQGKKKKDEPCSFLTLHVHKSLSPNRRGKKRTTTTTTPSHVYACHFSRGFCPSPTDDDAGAHSISPGAIFQVIRVVIATTTATCHRRHRREGTDRQRGAQGHACQGLA